jgi:hypothetical protein
MLRWITEARMAKETGWLSALKVIFYVFLISTSLSFQKSKDRSNLRNILPQSIVQEIFLAREERKQK